jgi:hypothetical protein
MQVRVRVRVRVRTHSGGSNNLQYKNESKFPDWEIRSPDSEDPSRSINN